MASLSLSCARSSSDSPCHSLSSPPLLTAGPAAAARRGAQSGANSDVAIVQELATRHGGRGLSGRVRLGGLSGRVGLLGGRGLGVDDDVDLGQRGGLLEERGERGECV